MQNGPEGQNKEGTEKNPPGVEEVVTKASCFISVGVGVGGRQPNVRFSADRCRRRA